MHRRFLQTGIICAALAVIFGAFGAHGLKQHLTPDALQIFETGVRYQMYHAIALIVSGMMYAVYPSRKIIWAGIFFTMGTLLFSGSLYILAMLLPKYPFIGAITPLGGVSFILGWICLLFAISDKPVKS